MNLLIRRLPKLELLDPIAVREKFITTELNFKAIAPYKLSFTSPSPLSAASLSRDISLFNLPAGAMVEWACIKHSVIFAGTGITSVKLSVGITSDLQLYLQPFEVAQAPGGTVFLANSVRDIQNFSSETSVRLAAVSEGANLSALTSGQVDIWVKFAQLG